MLATIKYIHIQSFDVFIDDRIKSYYNTNTEDIKLAEFEREVAIEKSKTKPNFNNIVKV